MVTSSRIPFYFHKLSASFRPHLPRHIFYIFLCFFSSCYFCLSQPCHLELKYPSQRHPTSEKQLKVVFENVVCCCLFGFNIAFNNFSVISQRCLIATGSSMLTFIVLPHWSYHAPDTWHDTTPSHISLTLGRLVLALHVSLSAKPGATSTNFNDFGMSWPGIKPLTSSSLEQTIYRATGARSFRDNFTYFSRKAYIVDTH